MEIGILLNLWAALFHPGTIWYHKWYLEIAAIVCASDSTTTYGEGVSCIQKGVILQLRGD